MFSQPRIHYKVAQIKNFSAEYTSLDRYSGMKHIVITSISAQSLPGLMVEDLIINHIPSNMIGNEMLQSSQAMSNHTQIHRSINNTSFFHFNKCNKRHKTKNKVD